MWRERKRAFIHIWNTIYSVAEAETNIKLGLTLLGYNYKWNQDLKNKIA